MIKQEIVIINNKEFKHTYSKNNMYILQNETNTKYSEAYDVLPLRYTYKETNEVIVDEENER